MSTHDQADLFSSGPAAPVDLAPGAERHVELAARLPSGLRMGTSSWAFSGWTGLVWDREVPKKVLSNRGLTAYARHPLFRAVGLDRTYYGPIPERDFRRYAEQTPADFRFLVKADRRLVFPDGPGSDADLFLNPVWAVQEVLGPATSGLSERLGALLLQFPPVPPHRVGGARGFAESLYRFLDRIPEGLRTPVRVEIRTPALMTPDYLAALDHAGVDHGYVVHPEMTDLPTQLVTRPLGHSTGLMVVRWMLQPGHRYAAAKEAWAPFDRVRSADAVRRSEVTALLRAGLDAGRPVILIVNNKAEGSAPGSIEAIAAALGG